MGAIIIIFILLFISILIVGGIFAMGFLNSFLESLKQNDKEQQKNQPQPTNQPTNQPINQPTNQQVIKPTIKPTEAPVCNRGKQRALMGLTCADVASKQFGSGLFMNNEQNIFMRQMGMDFNTLGHKFPGEVCWSNEIQNCVSQNCSEKNRNARDIAICKIKENVATHQAGAFFDPGVDTLGKRFNLSQADLI
jgi:hypothetical protein